MVSSDTEQPDSARTARSAVRAASPGARDADRRAICRALPRRLRGRGHQDRATGHGRPAAQVGQASRQRRIALAPRPVARQAVGNAPTCTTPAIKSLVRRLAMQSDVLLENFRPGRLEEWNLDPADLIAANPRLIVVRISGYGQDGPLRDQPGFGTIAEAAGGMRYVTGDPDRPPARTGLSLGDSIPSLHALVGLLIALHERNSSGRGQIVDVSLADSIFAMLEGILPEYGYLGLVRERSGGIAHNSGPTNTYPCADGTVVCIAANTTGLFKRLFEAIGRPDYANDESLHANEERIRRTDELDRAIESWTSGRSADEVVATLRLHRVPVSRISSIAEICGDPQFVARRDDRGGSRRAAGAAAARARGHSQAVTNPGPGARAGASPRGRHGLGAAAPGRRVTDDASRRDVPGSTPRSGARHHVDARAHLRPQSGARAEHRLRGMGPGGHDRPRRRGARRSCIASESTPSST